MPVVGWNQHPDFLILHPRRGLLVIEVKDWKLENIRSSSTSFLRHCPTMKDDVAMEARLLCVATTRAMERLNLTHHGDSRFVGELSEAIAA